MHKQLPSVPSLTSLKNQAKKLLKAHHSDEVEALSRIGESFPRLSGATVEEVRAAEFSLRDAQLVVSREYGFASWPKMVAALEVGIDEPPLEVSDAESEEALTSLVNPYITGTPVRNPKSFFGREDDFAYIRQALSREGKGSVVLLVGGRRRGKTSALFQILDGRLGREFLPIFIDMQLMAQIATNREFFARMAEVVLEQIADPRLVDEFYDFSQGNPILTFDRLLEDVQQAHRDRRLVFLMDESEILLSMTRKERMGEAALTYMASILESRKVSFCCTGSKALVADANGEWKKFIERAEMREIGTMAPEDIQRLIQEPVKDHLVCEEEAVELIYRLTGGSPYWTQCICSMVVDRLKEVRRSRLTAEDVQECLPVFIDDPPPQLVYIWDELDDRAQTALALMSESGPIRVDDLVRIAGEKGRAIQADEVEATLESLCEAGHLELGGDGTYRFSMDLFRQWVYKFHRI